MATSRNPALVRSSVGPHALRRPIAPLSLLAMLLIAAMPGCGQLRLSSFMRGEQLKTTSEIGGAQLAPVWRTSVYADRDAQSADLYLSDLPPERLADLRDPMTDLAGTIVHVAIFLEPKAGATPIDPSACNAAVRQLVLAQGTLGLYGGGGFVVPSGLGDAKLTASVRGATLRLVRTGPGFDDLLGPSTVSGVIRATRDPGLARVMAQRLQDLGGPLKPVEVAGR